MKRRTAILLLLLLTGWTPAEIETAHKWSISFRDQYWECLAKETVRMLPTKVSAQDFSLFLKGACPDQAQKFRVAMVDYFAMKHPDIPAQTHLSSADNAISLGQADALKFFIEQRAGAK
jgi:hypothetical protein